MILKLAFKNKFNKIDETIVILIRIRTERAKVDKIRKEKGDIKKISEVSDRYMKSMGNSIAKT